MNQDGSELQTIIPPEAGYLPNDLVFDAEGGFYFTDFKGTAPEPAGGVHYTSPDFSTVTPVLPNLAMANGIVLSPGGKSLWATEFGRNLLHRIHLTDANTIAPIGSAIAYRFVGPAPDSMPVDVDGNVYVAIYGQGRVLAFNRNGIPIGQVLLPGRDDGHNLASTSLAIDPDATTSTPSATMGDPQPGRDLRDQRSAHRRADAREPQGAGAEAFRRGADETGRDLAGTGRRSTRRLRLVRAAA